ncbi:MAG: hypothetical protein QOH81_2841 [Sphingomonadales bacterium]|jgi:hypothetical protein|nr:hypothetical protein [Sphingomonadales bacterium]
MGTYGDDRYGGDRWRERNRDRDRDRDYGRGDYRGQSGRGSYGGRDDDRGFLDRAGDEVRSWFGDEEAQRRREADERRWAREQGMTGRRDNDYGRDPGQGNAGGFGGGWGNQRGESWNRERPGERGWFGGDRGERDERFADGYGGEAGYGAGYGVEPAEPWGGSGYGGDHDRGRRFDRVDVGSTGTHGAHPMSAPTGVYEGRFGPSRTSPGNASRYAAIMDERGGGQSGHDPHYSEWRRRQIEDLDRDYDEYRREHHSKFEQEFGSWRSKRQGQRQALNKVTEHMEVVGSDGSHVGKVDKVRGDRIILARSDPDAGGIHHSIPCSWVENVDDKVSLNRTAEEAKEAWRSEERNRALFERGNEEGGDGPRNLDRSFSGTYRDRDE